MRIVDAKKHDLRRVEKVPTKHRTQARTECADWLEREVFEKDRWPVDLTDLEAESEWSRQHIKNVLDHYFEIVDENVGNGVAESLMDGSGSLLSDVDGKIQIDIPNGVDRESFLRGYFQGFIDADGGA